MDNSQFIGRATLTLSDELFFYDCICDAIVAGDSKVPLGEIPAQRAFQIMQIALCDHPEYYWASFRAEIDEYPPKLTMDFPNELARTAEMEYKLNRAINLILDSLPATDSEYERAKAVYATMACYAEYGESGICDLDADYQRAHSCIGCLVDRQAVCEGIAKATQLLLNRVGLSACMVPGIANDTGGMPGPHAWVLVRIDGSYFYMDPTWGGCKSPESNYPSFAYFLMTDEDMSNQYQGESPYRLPSCNDQASTFFEREGLTLNAWNSGALTLILKRHWHSQCERTEIKISDQIALETVKDGLDNGDVVYDSMQSAADSLGVSFDGNYRYAINDEMRVLALDPLTVGGAR